MLYLWILLAIVAVPVLFALGWRVASRFVRLPCPSLFAWMVDGKLADRMSGTSITLDRMRLVPGMAILEIGPGPGRLLVPAAFRVLPGGRATGIDIQYKMVEKLKAKAAAAGTSNLTALVGDATDLKLPADSQDLVYLCTVLGEIPNRQAALAECHRVLKPGGRLSITEIMGDPHYQSRAKVTALCQQIGFEPDEIEGNWRLFTANFRKPEG